MPLIRSSSFLSSSSENISWNFISSLTTFWCTNLFRTGLSISLAVYSFPLFGIFLYSVTGLDIFIVVLSIVLSRANSDYIFSMLSSASSSSTLKRFYFSPIIFLFVIFFLFLTLFFTVHVLLLCARFLFLLLLSCSFSFSVFLLLFLFLLSHVNLVAKYSCSYSCTFEHN